MHRNACVPLCWHEGYRLRVLRVNDLPLHTTFDGRTFEFQLGVSLYDEAYGTFYGNTVYRCWLLTLPRSQLLGARLTWVAGPDTRCPR
jgi:hypothetical protein